MVIQRTINRIFREIKAASARRSANKQFKKMSQGLTLKPLSQSQKKEIKKYYREKLGVKVSTKWHELAYTITGNYDKRFIPHDLYVGYIQPALIDYRFKLAFDDKNLYPSLLPWIQQPERIVQCSNGVYYSAKHKYWGNQTDIIQECKNIDHAIIKPTLFSNSGHGVAYLSVTNGITNINGETIESVMNRYGNNFVIENIVSQHKDMLKLNPSSLNTLRVISFRIGKEVLICQMICRIGKPGSVCDNFSQGGIAVAVNHDGTLSKYGYTKYYSHPVERTMTGVTLNGFVIPGFQKIKETVIKAHLSLPQFPLLAWDIAVDEDSRPILIEYNIHFGSTIALELGLPLLGDYTDLILPIVRKEYEKKLDKKLYICLS